MERVEDGSSMNVVPPMFHAGISNKFTKRHLSNFRDTTLTAASAAKQRAERKLERQADAIEKQQQKIDHEMKKISEITQNLHRQQLREAKRLRSRLNYAASKIQAGYRRHLIRVNAARRDAAICIQTLSRGFLARRLGWRLRLQREEYEQNCFSEIISRCIRKFAARSIRAREIELRYWAACSIQGLARIAAARSYVHQQRRNLLEAERQHRVAVVIQCNARSFMTRLIYLDVLYLICRIQAAMRGHLVRKQLRWLRTSDIEAISKLQAHIRRFLVRRRIRPVQRGLDFDCTSFSTETSRCLNSICKTDQAKLAGFETSKRRPEELHDKIEPGLRTTRAASFSLAGDGRAVKNGVDRVLGRSSTGLGWQPADEPAIKRSYWLPAGASFDRRLPVLPVPKRMLALERGDPLGTDELRLVNQSWTPKKRPHQKPCPARLSPVIIPSVKSDLSELTPSEVDPEGDTIALEKEERLRRQEELQQKLQLRRNQEKRQQEHELKLKREAESEASERKLMEREEKAIRLQLKILRRRSKEGKIRQVTTDQRREERERLAMAREERHVRLHIKFCARQQSKKRLQLATASEADSRTPSASTSSRHEAQARRKLSTSKSRKVKSKSKGGGDASSDDDGDMSFLDINFTIPASMQSRKPGASKVLSTKPRKGRVNSSGVPVKKKKRQPGGENITEVSASSGRDMAHARVQESTETDHDDDCGYGDEFDDVVDEAALSQLIC